MVGTEDILDGKEVRVYVARSQNYSAVVPPPPPFASWTTYFDFDLFLSPVDAKVFGRPI